MSLGGAGTVPVTSRGAERGANSRRASETHAGDLCWEAGVNRYPSSMSMVQSIPKNIRAVCCEVRGRSPMWQRWQPCIPLRSHLCRPCVPPMQPSLPPASPAHPHRPTGSSGRGSANRGRRPPPPLLGPPPRKDPLAASSHLTVKSLTGRGSPSFATIVGAAARRCCAAPAVADLGSRVSPVPLLLAAHSPPPAEPTSPRSPSKAV